MPAAAAPPGAPGPATAPFRQEKAPGPCKRLAATVFPQKAAGDKYNPSFVSYRVDAEREEGAGLAEKYGVNAYPTHLFINPANGALVYRAVGYSGRMEDFLHEADVALLEHKDPVSWEKYHAQFKAGKRDKAFLKAYLEKAKRLGENNDAILDAYVTAAKGKLSPADVSVVTAGMMTMDNKAFRALSPRWEAQHPDSRAGRYLFAEGLLEPTFEKAVAKQDEHLLHEVQAAARRYSKRGESLQRYYATLFYSQSEQAEKAKIAMLEEAQYYFDKTQDQYNREDEQAAQEWRYRQEREAAGDSAALRQSAAVSDPAVMHQVSTAAADRLNSLAWMVYEGAADDQELLTQASEWSKRSLQLQEAAVAGASAGSEWASYADTYAHLLYRRGNREEAVRMEEQALAAAGEGTAADAIRTELAKMKDGSL